MTDEVTLSTPLSSEARSAITRLVSSFPYAGLLAFSWAARNPLTLAHVLEALEQVKLNVGAGVDTHSREHLELVSLKRDIDGLRRVLGAPSAAADAFAPVWDTPRQGLENEALRRTSALKATEFAEPTEASHHDEHVRDQEQPPA